MQGSPLLRCVALAVLSGVCTAKSHLAGRLDYHSFAGHVSAAAGAASLPSPVRLPPPRHSTLGILNATALGVDSSGTTDTTAALQAAIVAAYDAQLALFLPPGRYLVSDTIWANQSNYGSSLPVNLRPARWRTNVILGSMTDRPTIVLAPQTPGFDNASSPRNVLKLHNTGRENDHMNQLLRSVNFEIGAGNPGAVGVFLHGAQGSSVQDVSVYMEDALAGFGGGGGAGASHLNIAAFGGQYGVLFAESEPGPVIAGGRFENQSVSAVEWKVTSTNAIGQGPLVVAGVEIVQAAGARGPTIASPALYLIDAKIRCDEQGGVAVSPGGYLQRVYAKGCLLTQNATRGSATGFTLINEMVAGDMWVDGERRTRALIYNASSDGAWPDAPDMVARHVRWDEATFPSFERAEVADAVLDCNATGDGFTDDTGALQECLNRFNSVFLPKGLYRISRTLWMRAGTALVGLSQTHSVIAPTTAGFAASTTAPAPLLRTGPSGAPVTIAFIGLVTWWHIPGVYTLEWRATQGLWRSNYETRVCECMWLSDYGSPNAAHGKFGTWPPTNCTQGVELSVPKTQIRGTGFFYNYVSDEDVLYTDHTGYRDLLVSNSKAVANASDRTVFYAVNLEHAMSEANGEIVDASHVDILGLKKEGSTVVLWIRDSVDVNMYGTAGGYTALATASEYPADFAQYTPSTYRVERTSPLKLAITAYHRSSRQLDEGGVHAEVKCSYPLDDSQLTTGHFPAEDWATLKKSLWAPWCGYWVTGANVLVEADGATKTIVATPDAGVLYMRGHAKPK